jgi:hypothetical protein
LADVLDGVLYGALLGETDFFGRFDINFRPTLQKIGSILHGSCYRKPANHVLSAAVHVPKIVSQHQIFLAQTASARANVLSW